MRDFDLQQLPLDRTALIEASAGTGKTFTIVNLMLRYLLEPFAGGDPLTIDRILVVTFTRAAVDELRGRIRQRIEQAARAIALSDGIDEGIDSCGDATLITVLQPHCGDDGARQRAAARLQAALLMIDEACVSTIHGFCQRVLADFAFEGGQYFEYRIISDQSDIVTDATQQFWRETFYSAPDFVAALAAGRWKTPQKLLQQIMPGLRPNVVVEPALDHAGFIAACNAVLAAFQLLSQQWHQQRAAIAKLLIENPVLNKTSYKPVKVPTWFDVLDGYFNSTSQLFAQPACMVYFTPEKLLKATKKNGATPEHEFFDACNDWMAMLDGFESKLLAYAASRVAALIADIKQTQRYVYFDDLLTLLDATLQREQSADLMARLRKQYPVALIDEFQDTDAIQYRIFSTLYGADSGAEPVTASGTAMLLIGDPKQAIYAFRGADINTYVQARTAVDDSAQYTLGRNFRSSEAVVKAINGLFTRQQDAFARGGKIGFLPVAFNASNAPQLAGSELTHAGFELQWINGGEGKGGVEAPRKKGKAMQMSAQHNAARILRLLTQPHTIDGKQITGNDIAVLVRDRVEAQAIRDELRAVGVDSVFLSKERVFATAEATTMYRVLSACARPRRTALIRAVLGSELIAINAQALIALADDGWSQHADRFHQLHRLWSGEGFYAMWRQLLRDYPVAANVLALPDGERRLTNLQQLADLVASFEHSRQIDITLRWFAREMQASTGDVEDQVLRLESEANLVQVVTIHRSKGLEYPIVFLPFLFRVSSREENFAVFFDNERQQVVVDFGSSQLEQRQLLARGEQHAEDIRLLYVALTRAKFHCVVTTGNVENLQRTALHSVLFGNRVDAISDIDEWKKSLRDIVTCDIATVDAAVVDAPPAPAAAVANPQQFGARKLVHAVPVQHRMHSYSSLIKMAAVDEAAHDYDAVASLDINFEQPSIVERVQTQIGIFDFPRGANAGTFWHEVLEKWRDCADETARLRWIDETLQRYGFEATRWRNVVDCHLRQTLQTRLLRESATTLLDLPATALLAEMEFFLPLSSHDAGDLRHSLWRDLWHYVTLDRRQRGHDATAAIPAQSLQGVLKGFIDAIVVIEGKYYVIDYKTNHLGSTEADYSSAAMEQEILHHDYDLQYLIYCVALHRLLGRRQADYDYAQHFGGVLYLFVRGMGHGGDFGVFRHLPSKAVIDGLDHVFAGAEMMV
jgi:exodeoxyribonuclease V beta subunit